jgi:tRNA (cmo5U34)-methyltransferase
MGTGRRTWAKPADPRLGSCSDAYNPRAYEALAPGGALLLVEKVLGSTAAMHEVLGTLYHRTKAANGYTAEQIQRKALALEGCLVPVTADWNVQFLQSAGFRHAECYWRHLCFAAWIASR